MSVKDSISVEASFKRLNTLTPGSYSTDMRKLLNVLIHFGGYEVNIFLVAARTWLELTPNFTKTNFGQWARGEYFFVIARIWLELL